MNDPALRALETNGPKLRGQRNLRQKTKRSVTKNQAVVSYQHDTEPSGHNGGVYPVQVVRVPSCLCPSVPVHDVAVQTVAVQVCFCCTGLHYSSEDPVALAVSSRIQHQSTRGGAVPIGRVGTAAPKMPYVKYPVIFVVNSDSESLSSAGLLTYMVNAGYLELQQHIYRLLQQQQLI